MNYLASIILFAEFLQRCKLQLHCIFNSEHFNQLKLFTSQNNSAYLYSLLYVYLQCLWMFTKSSIGIKNVRCHLSESWWFFILLRCREYVAPENSGLSKSLADQESRIPLGRGGKKYMWQTVANKLSHLCRKNCKEIERFNY